MRNWPSAATFSWPWMSARNIRSATSTHASRWSAPFGGRGRPANTTGRDCGCSRVATRCSRLCRDPCIADLRQECAERLLELDADGYAIGGLAVGEPRALSWEVVEALEPRLPGERPRYAMGVGMPEELPEYVARGMDMMDCVLPSRNARNGCLFTSQGRVIIKHARYKDDPRPVDESCSCYTCLSYSRAYLRHLYFSGEILYSVLATRHNLRRYLDIMGAIRHAIVLGKFPEHLKAVRSIPVEVE